VPAPERHAVSQREWWLAAAGAFHAIIVGDDEARGRMMTVRDLRSRGQQTVQIDDGAGVLALLGIDK